MINWYSLLANAIWILGLAILLARLSFRSFWKSRNPRLTRQAASAAPDWSEAAGLFLFCSGLFLCAKTLLEQIAWGGLALASLLWPMWQHFHSNRTSKNQ